MSFVYEAEFLRRRPSGGKYLPQPDDDELEQVHRPQYGMKKLPSQWYQVYYSQVAGRSSLERVQERYEDSNEDDEFDQGNSVYDEEATGSEGGDSDSQGSGDYVASHTEYANNYQESDSGYEDFENLDNNSFANDETQSQFSVTLSNVSATARGSPELEVPQQQFRISPIRPDDMPYVGSYTIAEFASFLALSVEEFKQLERCVEAVLWSDPNLLEMNWGTLNGDEELQEEISAQLREFLPQKLLYRLSSQASDISSYLVYKLFRARKAAMKAKMKNRNKRGTLISASDAGEEKKAVKKKDSLSDFQAPPMVEPRLHGQRLERLRQGSHDRERPQSLPQIGSVVRRPVSPVRWSFGGYGNPQWGNDGAGDSCDATPMPPHTSPGNQFILYTLSVVQGLACLICLLCFLGLIVSYGAEDEEF
ncbi:hypothetical protein TWF718_005781 [Orbilia javanica]|uniref:Uncharacterized protein n=1 Tax=Orbilia javanica TaxID=47235 RepID=A0AAN8NXK1_9PEZI